MKESKSRSLQYYMRVLHRNLGFLTLGMTMVYALSGIVLIHRTGDFMKEEKQVEVTLKPGLEADRLGEALKMKKFSVKEEKGDVVYFADGQYDKRTGRASYVRKDLVFPLDKFAGLHKLADGQNRGIAWFTTAFGIILFFLAFSSLFMFKITTPQFKKNMAYTAVGIVLTIVLLALL